MVSVGQWNKETLYDLATGIGWHGNEERERTKAEKRRADEAESRADEAESRAERYEKILKEHGLLWAALGAVLFL